ncbi:hypothetical protein LWC08_08975 [Desulfobaculum bizertense]|uniref:hypothetical protein n=1 Tax=Desulfobaculum bizertense TaxID=376490 RepID=UPI001F311046|nr:hypothetical protein [Desulfobaculum bizertense]UIJ36871.1 hypothetical protein LWC08_08975 [Desulfobaculum bizertense]
MGKALEWLGPEGCRNVAMQILASPKPAHDKAGEIGAACPFHTESTPGGAFSYNFAKDTGFCLSCGTSADLIGIYNALNGRAPKAGEGFIEFKKAFAPDAPAKGALPTPKKRQNCPSPRWEPRLTNSPLPRWSKHAESFLRHSEERLAQNTHAQAQLRRWGIDEKTARACRFGWNDKDKFPPVTSWGLPYNTGRQGKEAKIYLPAGLVIPFFAEGTLQKLKIRRAAQDAAPRYWHVVGSSRGYSVYGKPEYPVWLVVETERDAAMLWGILHREKIGAISTGSATARPDCNSARILRSAACVLVALDNDTAGDTNSEWWANEFPNSIRCAVPKDYGKDPGDAFAAELDFRSWVYSALPSHARHELERLRPQIPQPKPQKDGVSLPDAIRRALHLLPQCSLVALKVTPEWQGLEGCTDCSRAGKCSLFSELSDLLWNNSDVWNYVADRGRVCK